MVHVILAGFARATDVLTWVIDLNAGSAGLPWVRPALDSDGAFVDGHAARCRLARLHRTTRRC